MNQIITQGTNVYVAGEFTKAGTQTANGIARWDGATWSRIGSGVGPSLADGSNAYVYTVALVGSDLYVGGRFTKIDNVAANNIARWNGNSWSALGEGIGTRDFNGDFTPDATVYTLAPNGAQLYVGGRFGVAGTNDANAIALWNGSAWSPLGSGVRNGSDPGTVRALALSGTTLYAGGSFDTAGDQSANNVAAWNGSAWSALDLGVSATRVSSDPVLSIVANGATVYVGGTFTDAGGETRQGIARWNATTQTWSNAGPAIANRFDSDSLVEELAFGADGGLFVGGVFETAGELFVNNIAKLASDTWIPLGRGVGDFGNSDSGKIRAVAVDGAGRVYIGGDFEYAGAVPAKNLAMWDGTQWFPIGDADKRVNALVAVGDDLYVGGEFSTIGGIAANYIARWNRVSGQWSSLDGGMNGKVYTLAWSNGLLYAGGDYTAAGSTTAYDLGYWDGAQWSAFGTKFRIYERGDSGSEVGTQVHALAVQGDTVIIGGSFQTVHLLGTDTQPLSNYRLVNNVVGWQRTTDTWFYIGKLTDTEEPGVTTDGSSGFGTRVRALAINGGDVYIGGAFNKAGTQGVANIVRWSTAGDRWSSLNSGVGGVDSGTDPTEVWGLALRGSGLYVAGHFTTAGSANARFVGRWDASGSTWSALGSGLGWYNDQFTYAYALGVAPGAVYVGGVFSTAGGTASVGFAQWVPETAQAGPTATGTIVVSTPTVTATVPGMTVTATTPTATSTVPGTTVTATTPTATTSPTTMPVQGYRVFLPLVQR